MTNLTAYTRITQPLAQASKPDVTTHEDIDWRTVSVAEAIDADRQRAVEQRAKLDALKAKRRKRTWLTTLAEVFGVRRAS